MASSGSSRPTRQDYVARIRYVNNLPPPPIPPKFLNVPGTGLPNDEYTKASFASRLAREQPINIETDAELGMPIDLVGMPGVFDGDESSISALPGQPAIHPHDEPLLKPLASLRRADTSVASFLRKNEYLTSGASSGLFNTGNRHRDTSHRQNLKRKAEDTPNESDPKRIARDIEKSFEIADFERHLNGDAAADDSARKNWDDVKHPTNPRLTLMDAYPILPDIDAIPDTGSYSVLKYTSNPVTSVTDTRLNSAVLYPRDPPRERIQLHQDEQNERVAKGETAQPLPFDYDLFIPGDENVMAAIQAARSESDPASETTFEFPRLRTYETQQQGGNDAEPFSDNVAMVLHDGDEDGEGRGLKKGAYFYPIGRRNIIRTQRAGHIGNIEESIADIMDVSFRAADENEKKETQDWKVRWFESPAAA